MNFPPENFEQLRQLALLIRQGEIDLPMGKKSLSAYEKMVSEPDVVALSNIVDLSNKINLSPASITRLAKLLGFQGFNQFQLLFKQKSKIQSDFYSAGVKKLLSYRTKKPQEVLTDQLQLSIDNMNKSITAIDDESLTQAKNLLARKNRVFIFGYRQSSALANILRYGLALIRPNVRMLLQENHGVAVALSELRRGDLLVVFGSAPYSNVTVKIAALAKKQQCELLAITDSSLSPFNELSQVSIHIPTAGHFYTNSLVANCFFVEALLSLTAIELGQTAINNLTQHEALLSELEISS